jgi:sugar phosphate isomerase/epimerase
VSAAEWLGPLVFHAAAKDTLIHEDNCRVYGVLDDRHTRVPASENPLNLGGRSFLNAWPADPAWEFVAVGRGHDVEFWARFLAALAKVDPDMAVNIEHEDRSFDQVEGLRRAAGTLLAAHARASV